MMTIPEVSREVEEKPIVSAKIKERLKNFNKAVVEVKELAGKISIQDKKDAVTFFVNTEIKDEDSGEENSESQDATKVTKKIDGADKSSIGYTAMNYLGRNFYGGILEKRDDRSFSAENPANRYLIELLEIGTTLRDHHAKLQSYSVLSTLANAFYDIARVEMDTFYKKDPQGFDDLCHEISKDPEIEDDKDSVIKKMSYIQLEDKLNDIEEFFLGRFQNSNDFAVMKKSIDSLFVSLKETFLTMYGDLEIRTQDQKMLDIGRKKVSLGATGMLFSLQKSLYSDPSLYIKDNVDKAFSVILDSEKNDPSVLLAAQETIQLALVLSFGKDYIKTTSDDLISPKVREDNKIFKNLFSNYFDIIDEMFENDSLFSGDKDLMCESDLLLLDALNPKKNMVLFKSVLSTDFSGDIQTIIDHMKSLVCAYQPNFIEESMVHGTNIELDLCGAGTKEVDAVKNAAFLSKVIINTLSHPTRVLAAWEINRRSDDENIYPILHNMFLEILPNFSIVHFDKVANPIAGEK